MTCFIATQLVTFRHRCASLADLEEGQDQIEYALLAAMLSIFCIAALTIVGPQISTTFNSITGTLQALFG